MGGLEDVGEVQDSSEQSSAMFDLISTEAIPSRRW